MNNSRQGTPNRNRKIFLPDSDLQPSKTFVIKLLLTNSACDVNDGTLTYLGKKVSMLTLQSNIP